jgi:hypothetical protein
MRFSLALSIPALLAVAPLAGAQQTSHQPSAMSHAGERAQAAPAAQKITRAQFAAAMRQLWEDHITWTRLYIVSAVAGLPDAQPTAQRLLQNQADIGNAIKPFYGDAAGERLTALLRSHILIAADLVTAAKAGNATAAQDASTRWYANANDIADFLSGANPRNWSSEALRAEMRHHLELTLQEAQARLKGDWSADIAAYDAIHKHILGMSDVLSSGIISQFPQKF